MEVSADLKSILNVITSEWTPSTFPRFKDLVKKSNLSSTELDSVYILSILLQIPGVATFSLKGLIEKYNHTNRSFEEMKKSNITEFVPHKVLIEFFNQLPLFIKQQPYITNFFAQFVPVLDFAESHILFPKIIALKNIYLINVYIDVQSGESLHRAAKQLLSSRDTLLICKIFPIILKKDPNLIYLCLKPLNTDVLKAGLLSNLTGKISELNFAYIIEVLRNFESLNQNSEGNFQQNYFEFFFAFCIYTKKFFISKLDIEFLYEIGNNENNFANDNILYNLGKLKGKITEVINTILEQYPLLFCQEPFLKNLRALCEEAKKVCNVKTNVEDFIHFLVDDSYLPNEFNNNNNNNSNKICNLSKEGVSSEVLKVIASSLITRFLCFPTEENTFVNMILLLKEKIKIVEFPEFLVSKILRVNLNLLEKLKDLSPIAALVNSIIKEEDNVEYLNNLFPFEYYDPYVIFVSFFIVATSDYCRNQKEGNIQISENLLNFLISPNIGLMKIIKNKTFPYKFPKKAIKGLGEKEFDFNGFVAKSLPTENILIKFFDEMKGKKNIAFPYFEIADFEKKVDKLWKDKSRETQKSDSQENDSFYDFTMTITGNMCLPDDRDNDESIQSFDDSLVQSGFLGTASCSIEDDGEFGLDSFNITITGVCNDNLDL